MDTITAMWNIVVFALELLYITPFVAGNAFILYCCLWLTGDHSNTASVS